MTGPAPTGEPGTAPAPSAAIHDAARRSAARRSVTRRSVTRRRTLRRFVPPQHGAWAMLLVPYLAGVLTAGFRWLHLPLLGAWLAGYLLSYYALQAVKSRRPARFRGQILVYGAATATLGLPVVLLAPAVLWYSPIYAALLAVNTGYAWVRRERAVLNDLASVAQSCLMVFVVATAAGTSPGQVVEAFLAVLAYFTGTVLYVKTMIRERGSAAYRRLSVGFHVLALAGAALLGLPLAILFALLLARAWLLPGRGLRPARVGVMEIAGCVLLLIAIWLSQLSWTGTPSALGVPGVFGASG
jgi:hypothetical protein